ncbi:MAG: hypothetical protein FWF51_07380 [Chitinivibrionia bacterium]|nr:hypothetical protein [Chitinivibrionia bacterium]
MGCEATLEVSLTEYDVTLVANPGIIEGANGASTKTYKLPAGGWWLPNAIDGSGSCTFNGWKNSSGNIVGIGGASITILSDTTLYSTWRGNNCSW